METVPVIAVGGRKAAGKITTIIQLCVLLSYVEPMCSRYELWDAQIWSYKESRVTQLALTYLAVPPLWSRRQLYLSGLCFT